MEDLLLKSGFVLNEETKVWTSKLGAEFHYSDGDDAELYLLDAIRSTPDVSIISQQLKEHIRDWPSNYHLSRRRSNLLRLFENSFSGKVVLEIGCGCGAITRFLGEAGATVIAVEGSARRAQITRERCRDLDNVHVVCATGDQVKGLDFFDAVLLIGVLEYAKIYGGVDGHKYLLSYCRKQLKKDGTLFIAIENQMGLKYFAGAPEDHTSKTMFGINNSYDLDGVCTYGRQELYNLLSEADFKDINLYLPFPDYKLPIGLFTPQAHTQFSNELSGLASELFIADPQPFSLNTFSMEQATNLAWKNGLGSDLSNSFLFVASPVANENSLVEPSIIAEIYSDSRRLGLNKKTTFIQDFSDDSKIIVQATPLDNLQPSEFDEIIHQIPYQEDFYRGDTLWLEFVKILNKPNWDPKNLLHIAQDYLKALLLENSITETYSIDTKLDGKSWDMTPFNAIRKIDGNIVFIDREWIVKYNLDLGYVVFRGLLNTFLRVTSISESSILYISSPLFIIRFLMEKLGLEISEKIIEQYLDLENIISASIVLNFEIKLDNLKNFNFSNRIHFEHSRLNDELKSISCEKDTLTQERDVLTHGNGVLTQERDVLTKEKDVLIGERNMLTQERDVLTHENGVLTQERDVLTHENGVLTQERDVLTKEKDAASRDLRVASDLILEIKKSTSWKITAPMRHMKNNILDKSILIVRRSISRISYTIWLNLPLSLKNKIIIKNFLFQKLGMFFSWSMAYQNWVISSKYNKNIFNVSVEKGAISNEDKIKKELFLKDSVKILIKKENNKITLPIKVDIIIPVYNGIDFLDAFFESLFKNTFTDYRLIVIDDCSPDSRIWPYLNEKLKGRKNIVLIKNNENLGFVKSFNKAYSYTNNHFVCLNTDIILPPGWLERLLNPILMDPRVASVTPFTNAGTICSFPLMNLDNNLLDSHNTQEIDSIFQLFKYESTEYIEIPTCVGFCTAYNKDVADKIGMLDEIFSPGYGEENDWSLRAIEAGYKNIIVTNLFVYHKHGASFNTAPLERDKIRSKHLKILVSRYPYYDKLVQKFIASDPLLVYRTLAIFLACCRLPKMKCILIVDHNLGGGANKYREEMVRGKLQEGDQGVIVLYYDVRDQQYILSAYYKNYCTSIPFMDLEEFEGIVKFFNVGEIFYNNCVGYPSIDILLQLLIKIINVENCRLTVSFHDFFPVCPSYTLLDNNGAYCGVPTVEKCNLCLKNNKYLFPDNLKGIVKDVNIWRKNWAEFLDHAESILFFSESTRSIVSKAFVMKNEVINIIPHSITKLSQKPKIKVKRKLNIGFLGAINYQKGAKIIQDMATIIEKECLDIDLTIIGQLEGQYNVHKWIKVHGPYEKDEISNLIEKYEINVMFFPSICPETFSYVISELMDTDMPIFSFNIGAPGDRIRKYPYGHIIDKIDPQFALEQIISFHNDQLLNVKFIA